MTGTRYRYYQVGARPVRVMLREISGAFHPVAAEVQERDTAAFIIDNSFLGEIDEGEEVREIDQASFDALTQGYSARCAARRADPIRSYFARQFGRIGRDDIEMNVTGVTFRNGDAPKAHECHDNVRRWVLENPGSGPVEGWILSGAGAFGCVFDAHSIINLPDGSFLDITPRPSDPVRFLRHDGDAAEFREVMGRAKQYPFNRYA